MRHHIASVICLLGALGAAPALAASSGGSGAAGAGTGGTAATGGPGTGGSSAGQPGTQAPTFNGGNPYTGNMAGPDAATTTQREQAAGVAGSAATQQNENITVEQLDQEVQQNALTHSGVPPAGCAQTATVNCPP